MFYNASGLAQDASKAALISIQSSFNSKHLLTARSRIDQALGSGAKTIIFQFSGLGRSFENSSDLARDIVNLAAKKQIHTIAFVPKEALGMTMLPVFACQTIIGDEFAQLGVAYFPTLTNTTQSTSRADSVGQQRLANKIATFAAAAGHDPILARAMTEKKLILYQITLRDETKLVDQVGFETLTRDPQAPWKMAGSGPIVGADQILLLDGRRALELGLLESLASSSRDLLDARRLELIALSPAAQDPSDHQPTDSTHAEDVPAPEAKSDTQRNPKAVVIICENMIDEGLYESIKRRTEMAIADGATHIIYQIDTFGGGLMAAISIWEYFMYDVSKRAHTVAYVPTKAISAGALISVACNDIIMNKATSIGDCAPITSTGTKLEGTEREKVESPTRTYFENAAEANNYPVAICKAMVTIGLEVYQVTNLQTGEEEYFEADELPDDHNIYDLEGQKRIVKGDQLVTLTAAEARQYGLARTIVEDREEALVFLEKRDGVTFPRPVPIQTTNWSEEMVRWLTSPAVAGILLMLGMLGIYTELNSPGLGLPGAVAVVAFVILFGSKFLIGMSNWWEIMVFFMGAGLVILEIFIIPGFGIAGITGVACMLFAIIAMNVPNEPGQFPLPSVPMEWDLLERNAYGLLGGVLGFLICAYFVSKYLPKIPVANRLVLNAPRLATSNRRPPAAMSIQLPDAHLGESGVTLTELRPAGQARFEKRRLDVVSRGERIEPGKPVLVVEIEGNRVVVKEA